MPAACAASMMGFEVVAQAVVGARREDQRARVGVRGDGGQHRGARHRAEQAVLAVDRRVEVDRPRARQDHAVVDRLVAVAIEQQLVARRQQRLEDHLVGGGRAVGGEVGLARAEGLRGQALRLHDDAGGVQQRIEHLHRHGEVGAQQVLAGEVVEVAHPRAALERVAAGVARRVPAVLGHAHVVLQLVVERRGRLLGDLGRQDAGPAVVVALAAVEVAVHDVAGQLSSSSLFSSSSSVTYSDSSGRSAMISCAIAATSWWRAAPLPASRRARGRRGRSARSARRRRPARRRWPRRRRRPARPAGRTGCRASARPR